VSGQCLYKLSASTCSYFGWKTYHI